ncbi:nuclear factor 7, ovary-like [Betta splendens]|uniref:Nuclear factor 7, ovary-like n=1 Tax=Betta splendens TaxID=158456 RepID=A0A6P7NML9_BETSP|nr:nuclear factor 7, ovary-like [Betta splendens]XP_040928421.1 nuclear factor 7, ovary-like [Betta splendens]XP_055368093.1 nuclear factor 7, ovary-like [Betta splendens]XP_055368094.1 nuclear factor 7, ovary-like [Betta splendens]XP_055368095.1 nuclear factor 7, ovary-like [Betta splendens]XP_055368096.1 nuclear factor 7, ovary-like [Betta splendens]
MYNLKEVLWNTMENLKGEEFKNFKWFLKQRDIVGCSLTIPESRLETADRQDTVDLMVQKYACHEVLKITKKILQKISRNDLVERLKELNNRDTALLICEYENKKATLTKRQLQITTMIQKRRMNICEIRRSAELSQRFATRQTRDSEKVFTELLQSVKRNLSDLVQAIEEKQKTTQKQAEAAIEELEKDISELTKASVELEQLSHVQDQVEFLQGYSSLNAAPLTETELSIAPPSYGRAVGKAVHQLKEDFAKKTQVLIAKAQLSRVQQFAVNVTLDPDTANPYLVLTDDGKQVHCGYNPLNLPDKPQRFNSAINVLGKQSISSGRFYYEVHVEGSTSWDLGVVRESVNRKGSVEAKPDNGYWTMCLRNGDNYKAPAVKLRVQTPPKKVGVFVDYDKGSVSFYDVDSADVLHSFSGCSFQGKLHPFFSPGLQRGKNPTALIISSVNVD